MTKALRLIGWTFVTLLASVVTIMALRYFWLSPSDAAPGPLGITVAARRPLFLIHAAGGGFALMIGAWNMLAVSRRRFPNVHRWLGRIYLAAVFAGGIAGLALSTTAQVGLSTRVGFGMLALVWLVTGAIGLIRIRSYDIESHRRWMTRNYALTLAAVTLRIWLPLLMISGYEFDSAYPTVAWLCWVPNILLAEIFVTTRVGEL